LHIVRLNKHSLNLRPRIHLRFLIRFVIFSHLKIVQPGNKIFLIIRCCSNWNANFLDETTRFADWHFRTYPIVCVCLCQLISPREFCLCVLDWPFTDWVHWRHFISPGLPI